MLHASLSSLLFYTGQIAVMVSGAKATYRDQRTAPD